MKVVEFVDYELDGIDGSDAPKFVDAFIVSATAQLEDGTFRDATDAELDQLNDDSELVHELVMTYLY